MADQVGDLAHLNARDTTLAFVSRAPQPDIARWRARMGWEIPWYTITDDFDRDFGVDEWHGTNAFLRDGDRVFRTYFIDRRGDEAMGSTWSYLDITALGRQEDWRLARRLPQSPPYAWWNLHDEYEDATVFEAALSDAAAGQRGAGGRRVEHAFARRRRPGRGALPGRRRRGAVGAGLLPPAPGSGSASCGSAAATLTGRGGRT